MPKSVDQLLDEARQKLDRVSPTAAAAAMADGALLVDTRPLELRRRDGVVPGALIIDRNVLEWRLDPSSDYRDPVVDGYDRRVIVMCNEGFASSLVAAELQELGHRDATDVDGGFQAWKAAGLPTAPSQET